MAHMLATAFATRAGPVYNSDNSSRCCSRIDDIEGGRVKLGEGLYLTGSSGGGGGTIATLSYDSEYRANGDGFIQCTRAELSSWRDVHTRAGLMGNAEEQ